MGHVLLASPQSPCVPEIIVRAPPVRTNGRPRRGLAAPDDGEVSAPAAWAAARSVCPSSEPDPSRTGRGAASRPALLWVVFAELEYFAWSWEPFRFGLGRSSEAAPMWLLLPPLGGNVLISKNLLRYVYESSQKHIRNITVAFVQELLQPTHANSSPAPAATNRAGAIDQTLASPHAAVFSSA